MALVARIAPPALLALTLALPTAASADITGTVQFEGTAPMPKPLDMSADPICARLAPRARALDLQVADGGLANVFAYVADPPKREYVPRGRVIVDKKTCQFSPRVFGIQVGQKLVIRNQDPTLYSVRIHSRVGAVHRRLPKKGTEFSHRFKEAEGMVRLSCDVHGWSTAYAGVVNHPYFGVSGAKGAIRIPTADLPDGEYEVILWHEVLGSRTVRVQVADGEGRLSARFQVDRDPGS